MLALALTGDVAACLASNSFVGGVRACSLAEALDDGVDSEFSEELLMLAYLEGCSEDDTPLAGFFDAGSSKTGSERACFLPAATTAAAIGEGAAALNNAGEAF